MLLTISCISRTLKEYLLRRLIIISTVVLDEIKWGSGYSNIYYSNQNSEQYTDSRNEDAEKIIIHKKGVKTAPPPP